MEQQKVNRRSTVDKIRTGDGGRKKIQGGNLQQEMVWGEARLNGQHH